MQLGPPDMPAQEAPPARTVWRVELKDCTLNESMTLSIRVRRNGEWKKADAKFPDWRAAVKGTYTVLSRIWPSRAADDIYYFPTFKDGTDADTRKTPWWVLATGDELLFIWPTRLYEDYYKRLAEGTAVPLLGDPGRT